MSSVRRVVIGLLASVGLLLTGASVVPVANAQERTLTTFVAVLSAENEVPGCPAGVTSGARGVAIIQIDEDTGEISYRVVATNLPGTITGAHIHLGPAGVAGPIEEHLQPTGLQSGLVFAGTVTDEELANAILADPANYYVNVHTTLCTGGAVRGQLG